MKQAEFERQWALSIERLEKIKVVPDDFLIKYNLTEYVAFLEQIMSQVDKTYYSPNSQARLMEKAMDAFSACENLYTAIECDHSENPENAPEFIRAFGENIFNSWAQEVNQWKLETDETNEVNNLSEARNHFYQALNDARDTLDNIKPDEINRELYEDLRTELKKQTDLLNRTDELVETTPYLLRAIRRFEANDAHQARQYLHQYHELETLEHPVEHPVDMKNQNTPASILERSMLFESKVADLFFKLQEFKNKWIKKGLNHLNGENPLETAPIHLEALLARMNDSFRTVGAPPPGSGYVIQAIEQTLMGLKLLETKPNQAKICFGNADKLFKKADAIVAKGQFTEKDAIKTALITATKMIGGLLAMAALIAVTIATLGTAGIVSAAVMTAVATTATSSIALGGVGIAAGAATLMSSALAAKHVLDQGHKTAEFRADLKRAKQSAADQIELDALSVRKPK